MEKHGCSGLSRIISVAEGVQLIRFDPPNLPNSRSILRVQKNGTDAEQDTESCADCRAEPDADEFAVHRAVVCAKGFAACLCTI